MEAASPFPLLIRAPGLAAALAGDRAEWTKDLISSGRLCGCEHLRPLQLGQTELQRAFPHPSLTSSEGNKVPWDVRLDHLDIILALSLPECSWENNTVLCASVSSSAEIIAPTS